MNQDFPFRLDALRNPVTRRISLSQAVHIDLPMLGGIVVLICVGLFVLYSGSGQSMDTIVRQLSRFAVGMAVMLVMAQIPPAPTNAGRPGSTASGWVCWWRCWW